MNQPSMQPTAQTAQNDFSDDGARDPLALHFQKMSEFPLLTHDDEIALARRLERADEAIWRALLSCSEGRGALLELVRGLRDGELRIEDVERNPSGGEEEDLARRIETAVIAARARRTGRALKPGARAKLVRLHPRTLGPLVAQLSECAAREPNNTTLHHVLARIESHRLESDRATAEFVQSNLRIVVTFARRYRGMPLVDLIQEGNLGLLRAVDKFDHRRGLRFSTYAAWWIRHALSRALADQSKMIRVPVHLTGTVQRVRRAEERWMRETGRAPTQQDLAARTGIPLEQVRRALDVVAQPVSLDAPANGKDEREGSDLGDFVQDPAARAADDVLAESELRRQARELLDELPEREAEVLRLRYGLGGVGTRTLEEIGQKLSLSRERARQLERDALRKLRVVSEKRRLRTYLTG